MFSNYPMYNAQPVQNYYRQNQSQFIARQVTSIDEAKACLIDPLNTYLFVDVNAGKIYMKRIGDNGLSSFYTFSAEEVSAPVDPLQEIKQRITNLENKIGGLNVQSVSNVTKSVADNATANDRENESEESAVISESARDDKRKK